MAVVIKVPSRKVTSYTAPSFITLYLLLSAGLCLASAVQAQQVTVAVAANFAGAIKQLKPVFETETGHQLAISFASSGTLYAQIRNGAPFEVFLSADDRRPQQLISEGLAVKDSLVTYAIGQLVLWSSDPLLIDEQLIDQWGHVLGDGNWTEKSISHIAMANPKTAPYGAAARQTLAALGLTEATNKYLVTGQNVAQAFQFVISGNAQLGFIALSQVLALPEVKRGSCWQIPENYYTPLRQAAVQLNKGKDNLAARAFLDFLNTASARNIIHANGYRTVSTPASPPGTANKAGEELPE